MDADTPATNAVCPHQTVSPMVTNVFISMFPQSIWLRLTLSSVCPAFGSRRWRFRTMFALLLLSWKPFLVQLDRHWTFPHFVATRFVLCRVRKRRMVLRFPLNHPYKAYYEQAS